MSRCVGKPSIGWNSMLKVRLVFWLWQHPQRTLLRRLRKVQLIWGVCILLLANGLTTGYVAAQLENGLIGYWSFNEGSGTFASDSSGNGNNGTLVNGPIWTSGEIAGALSFDGVDDYVSFASQAQSTISISAWSMLKRLRVTYFPEL